MRHHLAMAVIENNGYTIRARCPACGTNRTLHISAGQQLRATWNCHNGCDQAELRAALIRTGISPGCLPSSKAAQRELGQIIAAAIQQGTRADRAHTILRAYLIALGHVRWPAGTELEKLATECDVSRSDAYKARKAGPLVSTLVPPVPKGSNRGL